MVAPGKNGFGDGYSWISFTAGLILISIYVLARYLFLYRYRPAFPLLLVLAGGFSVVYGICECIRKRSVRDLLFWIVEAITMGCLVVFWISKDRPVSPIIWFIAIGCYIYLQLSRF